MNNLRSVLVACAAVLFLGTQADAEERTMESVVVTGTLIDQNEDAVTPAISIKRQADFVLFEATFVNGSVDPDERRKQQKKMFDKVVNAAEKTDGLTLWVGDEFAHAPVETVTFDEAYQYNGRLSFILKIQTKEGDTFERVRARSASFIESVGTIGRSDVLLDDEQILGLNDARRYRMELLSAISEDADTLAEIFSTDTIEINGLHLAIITRPVGPLELEIFIPYDMSFARHDRVEP